MNYFAHGLRFLDDPSFLAGTAVPDWLCVAERRSRIRQKDSRPFAEDADPQLRSLACGITQHCLDDQWFHATRAFAELSWDLTRAVRDSLRGDPGMRPSFLGHVLVEILLDAELIRDQPENLKRYYQQLAALNPLVLQAMVNRIAPRPTQRLAPFISLFCRVRFLWDYLDDGKLLARLNQVMQRVRLPQVPASLAEILPEARSKVAQRKAELLSPGSSSPREEMNHEVRHEPAAVDRSSA